MIMNLGRRAGRFAVIPFVVPIILIFFWWLTLIDKSVLWFLVSATVIVPAFLIAVACLVGMLFSGIHWRSEVGIVETEAANEILKLWKSIAGARLAARTTLVLDDQLNASVQENRYWLLPFRTRIVLSVGLPLLAVVDQDAIEAILQHEYSHLLNRDTNGSLKLAELDNTLNYVFIYASPDTTISGMVLSMIFGRLSNGLQREQIKLSKEAELKADCGAASAGDGHRTARALLLVGTANEFLNETVYEPLRRELMGASTPPRSPLSRIFEAVHDLRDGCKLNSIAETVWRQPADPDSTHPSWKERLNALGFSELPTIAPIEVSALDTLVSARVREAQLKMLDQIWYNQTANALQ